MTNMINWLHISDLHLGSEGAITNMMRDELPDYLKELGVKCDCVFCTGDIRTANVSPNVFTDEVVMMSSGKYSMIAKGTITRIMAL